MTDSAPATPPAPAVPPPRALWTEAAFVWGLVTLAVAAADALARIPWLAGNAGILAAAACLILPARALARRGQDLHTVGLRIDSWPRELAWGFGVSAAILVPYTAVYVPYLAFQWLRAQGVAPDFSAAYAGQLWAETLAIPGRLHLRLPDGFAAIAAAHFLAIALPEEVLYRGYMQSTFNLVYPPRWRLGGAATGPAILIASAFFAAGHLAGRFAAFRLGVFFPSLLFGWLKERTGTLTAGIIFHALANLYVIVLDASFWGN